MDKKLHWWLVTFTFKRNGNRHTSSMYLSTEEQALPPNDIDMEIDRYISIKNHNIDTTTESIATSVSYLGCMTKEKALGLYGYEEH